VTLEHRTIVCDRTCLLRCSIRFTSFCTTAGKQRHLYELHWRTQVLGFPRRGGPCRAIHQEGLQGDYGGTGRMVNRNYAIVQAFRWCQVRVADTALGRSMVSVCGGSRVHCGFHSVASAASDNVICLGDPFLAPTAGPPNIGGEVGPKGCEKCSDTKWRKFEEKVRTGAIYNQPSSEMAVFVWTGWQNPMIFPGRLGPIGLDTRKCHRDGAEIVQTRTNRSRTKLTPYIRGSSYSRQLFQVLALNRLAKSANPKVEYVPLTKFKIVQPSPAPT
jgi:hypothetical protein